MLNAVDLAASSSDCKCSPPSKTRRDHSSTTTDQGLPAILWLISRPWPSPSLLTES